MEKISKEIIEGGVIYRNEKGEKINTYTEELDWILRVGLEPLRDFLLMEFETEEAKRVVNIARVLLEAGEEDFYKAADYIGDNFGMVEIESAMYHQNIEPETKLGVIYTPAPYRKGESMNQEEKTSDRLQAAMEEAARIKADREEERAAKLKQETITVNFSEVELERLRARADAGCMKLQDYIRHILKTYA